MCGFSGDFCGQSQDDDTHSQANMIILAFANTTPSGGLIVDDAGFPIDLIAKWHSQGKKVIISVGGQNGNWVNVFASPASRANFIQDATNIIALYKLD